VGLPVSGPQGHRFDRSSQQRTYIGPIAVRRRLLRRNADRVKAGVEYLVMAGDVLNYVIGWDNSLVTLHHHPSPPPPLPLHPPPPFATHVVRCNRHMVSHSAQWWQVTFVVLLIHTTVCLRFWDYLLYLLLPGLSCALIGCRCQEYRWQRNSTTAAAAAAAARVAAAATAARADTLACTREQRFPAVPLPCAVDQPPDRRGARRCEIGPRPCDAMAYDGRLSPTYLPYCPGNESVLNGCSTLVGAGPARSVH
jgi:hypothetical protein